MGLCSQTQYKLQLSPKALPHQGTQHLASIDKALRTTPFLQKSLLSDATTSLHPVKGNVYGGNVLTMDSHAAILRKHVKQCERESHGQLYACDSMCDFSEENTKMPRYTNNCSSAGVQERQRMGLVGEGGGNAREDTG